MPVDKVFESGPNRIFVFGSNTAGIHGAGAARTAYDLYGAVWGQGAGPQNESYAIPTKDSELQTLSIDEIAPYVTAFLEYAKAHPEKYFFVTRIGCGLAGYSDADMLPLFKGAPPNCELPHGWREET